MSRGKFVANECVCKFLLANRTVDFLVLKPEICRHCCVMTIRISRASHQVGHLFKFSPVIFSMQQKIVQKKLKRRKVKTSSIFRLRENFSVIVDKCRGPRRFKTFKKCL